MTLATGEPEEMRIAKMASKTEGEEVGAEEGAAEGGTEASAVLAEEEVAEVEEIGKTTVAATIATAIREESTETSSIDTPLPPFIQPYIH